MALKIKRSPKANTTGNTKLDASRDLAKMHVDLIRTCHAQLGKGGLLTGAWKSVSLGLSQKHFIIKHNSLLYPGKRVIWVLLEHITKLERCDLSPCCLLIMAKGDQYNISFGSDTELYDWQDDIYSRCPLGSSFSSPYGFVHQAHVGADSFSGNLPPQFAQAFDPKFHLRSDTVDSPISDKSPLFPQNNTSKALDVKMGTHKSPTGWSSWKFRWNITPFRQSARFDPVTGQFVGLPDGWTDILNGKSRHSTRCPSCTALADSTVCNKCGSETNFSRSPHALYSSTASTLGKNR